MSERKVRIDFQVACPMCGDLVTASGEVSAGLSSNERVEPLDRKPFEDHAAECHPGTKWTWGDSPSYRM